MAAPELERSPTANTTRPSFPVQRAKAQRPPLRRETLHRDRLLDWLSVNVHHRLVLLVAEAGYGKTTLLADFASRTRLRTLWFRVDEEDRDWISVLHYLVAAGREVDPGFAPTTHERLSELGTAGGTRDEIVRTFLAELARFADEPTILIVDDYHVLDESPDARSVIADVLARAPERFTLMLATRRRPTLAVARLRALGEVADLSTDDLRFTEPETEALFREAYQQPLEADVLTDLAHRTEGWAASLQLVRAAVRERSTAQIRAFVRSLSGVDENLYDYLAEEVVGELEPAMQDFLMRTSLLQVVDPVLAEVAAGVPQPDARRLIEAAERLGLLSRRGQTARHTVRYHPLVREFLEDRLRRDIGDQAVRDLHRAIARHGETTDWRLAAHHYREAGDASDIRRVVEQALGQLLGRGEADLARSFLGDAGSTGADPIRLIIESRLEYAASRFESALAKALAASRSVGGSNAGIRDIALFQLTSLQAEIGPPDECIHNAQLLATTTREPWLQSIAEGIYLVNEASESDLADVASHLATIVLSQKQAQLLHFAAVTLTNCAYVHELMGNPVVAARCATEALDLFPASDESPAASAAHAVLAWAHELAGDSVAAQTEMDRAVATDHTITKIESIIEAAEVQTWFGSAEQAERLLMEAGALPDISLRTGFLSVAEAALLARVGRLDEAGRRLEAARADRTSLPIAHSAKIRFIAALLHLRSVGADDSARSATAEAIRYARARHVGLYVAPLDLATVAFEHEDLLGKAVYAYRDHATAPISMIAEIIADKLHVLDDTAFEIVRREANKRPLRWRATLRAVVVAAGRSAARAGTVLDEIGDAEDVPILRTFARNAGRVKVDPNLGRSLARRLAPRVKIEDLGRLRLEIGNQEQAGSRARRKSLALLCYLLTRPGWSATKEQVLEALWPDAEPEVSANSLNQTLYFLRRVFDPRYKEDISAEYVHYDQDVMWLDSELIWSRSAEASRALECATKNPSPEAVEHALDSYTGGFALDFAYEEWAVSFRDALHIRFLEVVERALSTDAARGEFERAIQVARRAVEIDPEADQLEAILVRLYRLAGSHVAAAEQYEHYSRVVRSALGVEPPRLEDV